MLVDLSHPLEPGMPSYPGLPEPKFHVFLAHGDSPGQQKYVPGTTFQIARYELGAIPGLILTRPFTGIPTAWICANCRWNAW